MKRILPLRALAASAAPAADVAPIFPAPGTEARSDDGAAVRVEDGVAVVDIAAGGTSCGVKFVPAEPFALDGWREVRADVSNRTDRALDFTMHTLSKGTYRWYASGSFRVEAGESRTVSALCRPSARPMAPGGDGLPGLMGYDRAYRPDSVDASALAVEAGRLALGDDGRPVQEKDAAVIESDHRRPLLPFHAVHYITIDENRQWPGACNRTRRMI